VATKLTLKALGSAVAMCLLFLVLIASLYVLATTAERLDRFGRYYHWLLLINGNFVVELRVLV